MKIKGILITPNQKNTQPREYELEVNSYKDYYSLLECETFDIQRRNFKGLWLDIYCDDEGLFKENNKPSILTYNKEGQLIEQIVGNVFIVNHNGEGETISLNNKQIEAVLKTVSFARTNGSQEIFTVCIAKY